MIFAVYAGINTAWAGAILALAVCRNEAGWMSLACCGPLLFVAASELHDKIRGTR